MIENDSVKGIVSGPSASTALYQCRELRERLQIFRQPRYPSDTVRVRELLDIIAEQIEVRLEPLTVLRRNLSRLEADKPRALARIVHKLFAIVRYLQTTDATASPPGLQQAFQALVDRHLPRILRCDRSEIATLVRSQWDYNLKSVYLTRLLFQTFKVDDLDDSAAIYNAADAQADMAGYLSDLWERRGLNGRLPAHIGVLSFAALDRDDALLHPLLAHEVGHFVDFAYPGTIHHNDRLDPQNWLPRAQDVEAMVPLYGEGPLYQSRRTAHLASMRDVVSKRVKSAVSEITADLLATRMVGLPYFLALAQHFNLGTEIGPDIAALPDGYPSPKYRLRYILDELVGDAPCLDLEGDIKRRCANFPAPKLLAVIERWRTELEPPSPTPSSGDDETRLASDCVRRALPSLRALIREVIPLRHAARPSSNINLMRQLLAEGLPPFPGIARVGQNRRKLAPAFDDVLLAGWIHQVEVGMDREAAVSTTEEKRTEYRNTCTLLLKALELAPAQAEIDALRSPSAPREPSSAPQPKTTKRRAIGIVTGPSLLHLARRKNLSDALVVMPHFDDKAVQAASLDIHLGNWFKVAKRTNLTSFDLSLADGRREATHEGQEAAHVHFGEQFVVHPGSFALAASIEYFSVPSDVTAFVEGKSSIGRAGLNIVTASQVGPGFKGSVIFELFNAGAVPLVVKPGMPIAQVVFHRLDKPLPKAWLYTGPSRYQVKP